MPGRKLWLAAGLFLLGANAFAAETDFDCALAANDSSHYIRQQTPAVMSTLCLEPDFPFRSVPIEGKFDGVRYWLTFECRPGLEGLGRYRFGLMRETPQGGMRLVITASLAREGGDLVSYDYRGDGIGEFELSCKPALPAAVNLPAGASIRAEK